MSGFRASDLLFRSKKNVLPENRRGLIMFAVYPTCPPLPAEADVEQVRILAGTSPFDHVAPRSLVKRVKPMA